MERLVALNVVDDDKYKSYRDGMTPILETYGGAFVYDFKVSEVLRSRTPAPINRVFTIRFPTQESMAAFFSDKKYLQVKRTYFDPAVADATVIATYEI